MATLQNIGKLKYRGKDGLWHPLPVVVQDAGGGVSTISGNGAPTSATQGKVNQLYRNEDTQKLYICTATAGGYTWAAVVSDTEDAVTYTTQTLTEEQKTQARANIGAGTSNFSGLYNDLPDKPNIPAATVIDTTLTKSGQAADAKAAGDAIDKKLDKAQGVENAGMILGVDESGNVVPENKPVQALEGDAAPTTATAGVVGQEYYVIANGEVTEMYVCTAAANGTYTWGKAKFGAEIDDTSTELTKVWSAKKSNQLSQNITKLKEKKAEIDDTAVGANAWSSKNIVDMLCPPLEESGNPVVCYPVAGYPLGVKAKWEPMQEGSGTPSPENIRPINGRGSVTVERCGENLLRINPFNKITKYGITYEYVPDGGIHISGTSTNNSDGPAFPIWHLPPGKYCVIYPSKTEITNNIVVNRNGKSLWISFKRDFEILAGDVTKYWYVVVLAGKTVDNTVYQCIVPGATAPTTYTPYNGQTNTLTLPETVYGGEVDAMTGDGKRTWEIIDNYAGESIPREWISDRDVYSADKNPTVGAQVAYRLAEPVPFTATGAQLIPALAGTNTVLTDADSATVTGRADPIKRITDLEDAVASQTLKEESPWLLKVKHGTI